MDIKLTGWKALVLLAAIAVFVVFQYATATRTLETQGAESIKAWIASEYARYHLADQQAPLTEKAAVLTKTQDVRILDITARGPVNEPVVRVELAPSPAHPPGSPYVRYYRMEYSTLTGWRHRGDATELGYQLAIF